MLNATLVRPASHRAPADPARRVAAAATRLADAVAEFDAALDEGRPMFVLVRLDQEVSAADARHRSAVAAARSASVSRSA